MSSFRNVSKDAVFNAMKIFFDGKLTEEDFKRFDDYIFRVHSENTSYVTINQKINAPVNISVTVFWQYHGSAGITSIHLPAPVIEPGLVNIIPRHEKLKRVAIVSSKGSHATVNYFHILSGYLSYRDQFKLRKDENDSK